MRNPTPEPTPGRRSRHRVPLLHGTLFVMSRRVLAVVLILAACAADPASPMIGDARPTGPDASTPSHDIPDASYFCFADFPCRAGEVIRCTGENTFFPVVSHDCHYACGPGPCSGGTCDPAGPTASCPSGEHCVYGDDFTVPDHCAADAIDAGTDATP